MSATGTRLDAMLRPRSVAVVGASPRPGTFANQPLRNLRDFGFPGAVYPVNPGHEEVEGLRCFPSVHDLPEPVDLAVIVLRAERAVEQLEACAAVGVGAAVVVASGFAETGAPEGLREQERLVAVARATGMRVCGPNTLGVANFNDRTVPFASGNLPPRALAGPLAIVSQSGGCGFTLLNRAWSLGIGVGHLSVAGNEADVRIPDLIDWYLRQDDVKTVLCYIEALRDVDGLRRVASTARELGKPLFVMKSGVSPEGQRAASAHTGALASADEVCEAAFSQWGLPRARTFDALLAAGALAARHGPPPRRRAVGIYAQGGGMSVVMADLFRDAGIAFPEPSPTTVAAIRGIMPDTTPGNPFDSGGQFLSTGVEPLVQALESFGGDPAFDVVVHCLMPVAGRRITVYAEGIARAASASRKPQVVLLYRAGEITEPAVEILHAAGLLVLDPPEAAVEGLALWLGTGAERPQPVAGRPGQAPATEPLAAALVRRWAAEGRRTIGEHDACEALEGYGIPCARQRFARTASEAVLAAAELRPPLAVKVASADIPHRSDVGGVLLGVTDDVEGAARTVVDRASAARPSARIDGVVVEEMAAGGLELIVGIKRDATFGPVVAVGLGGVLAEVLRDVALLLPPIDAALAARALERLRGAELLSGYRGSDAVDTGAVVELVTRVGRFAEDLADVVVTLDLNPVVVHGRGDGLVVVDALLELASPPCGSHR